MLFLVCGLSFSRKKTRQAGHWGQFFANGFSSMSFDPVLDALIDTLTWQACVRRFCAQPRVTARSR
jgi:hypothetical protein